MLQGGLWTTLPDMRATLLVLAALGLAACASAEDGTGGSPAASSDQEVQSAKVLLDCNVFLSGGGPDQQVTVLKRGDQLFLRELTSSGATEERPLSAEEWEKKDLKLRNDKLDGPDAVNRLYLEDGDWMNESKSPGWHAMGFADCSDPR